MSETNTSRIERTTRTKATRGFRLGTLAGVEVRLDWSLLIIFALITFNLGAGLFPAWHPEWSAGLSWIVAFGSAVLFIGSILVHELSHALVARTQGIPVSRIDLFVFGGMAHMDKEPPSPKAEFLMAFIGPIVSITIGALATACGVLLADGAIAELTFEDPVAAMQAVGPVATLLLWLGPINILLGIFNMVPGFPLDGGRVLRSILWAITDDLTRATRWAAAVGQGFAWFLMAVGIFNLFGGAFIQGLWLLLIGWFLNNAARLSYEHVLVQSALEHVPIARVMRTHIITVAPQTRIESLVREHLMATDQQAFPVEREGVLLGLVCIDDIRKVPHQRWTEITVSEIMTPVSELSMLTKDETAEKAFEILARREIDQIPIVDGNHILGIVRRSDILKWMALQSDAPGLERAA